MRRRLETQEIKGCNLRHLRCVNCLTHFKEVNYNGKVFDAREVFIRGNKGNFY